MSQIATVFLVLVGLFVLLSIAVHLLYAVRLRLSTDPTGSRQAEFVTDWHLIRLRRRKDPADRADYLRAFMRRAQSTTDASFARFIGNIGGDILERCPDARYPNFEEDYKKTRGL